MRRWAVGKRTSAIRDRNPLCSLCLCGSIRGGDCHRGEITTETQSAQRRPQPTEGRKDTQRTQTQSCSALYVPLRSSVEPRPCHAFPCALFVSVVQFGAMTVIEGNPTQRRRVHREDLNQQKGAKRRKDRNLMFSTPLCVPLRSSVEAQPGVSLFVTSVVQLPAPGCPSISEMNVSKSARRSWTIANTMDQSKSRYEWTAMFRNPTAFCIRSAV